MKLYSYGKINLFLDIEGKLKNSYHLIKTVMQSIDIYDEIALKPLSENTIVIECSDISIPVNEKNTCYKAASLLKERYGINSGIHIYINKNIPSEAGLAGGSGNAAAVLKGLNIMWDLNLSLDELSSLGLQVGADIPFCLRGGTCLAGGIGDRVTDLNPFKWNNILIIKPDFSMSTAFVYQNLPSECYNLHSENKTVQYISSGDHEKAARSLANTLEKVVEKYHPEIKDIKSFMLDRGALSSLMTGSGSAVFGLFKDKDALIKAYNLAAEIYPKVFMAKTIDYGVKLID